ncbi:MAG: cell division protein ZapA [Flavobacteriales bacterium]|jgi:cell division protein ZapA|nr:cell division protein ZapA [Flavobacteriales bacterium]MBT4738650.1 cell division protein ZapA [Flavobacteriales bacterium]MBT5354001.1 cell division protein ZapA [Flavobacteriales bacterium]MBT7620635.1 cell division protein ZapA [Flavobacteriales bacterium]|tara:strand:- start:21 stop:302 length:282 start_codon:yes stop_codon:yes gene_type:complete
MSLKIKINIANRIYPMTINRDAEENIRKSVKKIEERLKFYEKNYAIKDRQDLLAMCLIEIATKLESVNDSDTKDNNDIEIKLSSIESALSEII